MSDQKTLGQVAVEALKSANGDNPGPGMTWEAAPDWVREKWECIGHAVILLPRGAADSKAIDERIDEARIEGAAEERERLARAYEDEAFELLINGDKAVSLRILRLEDIERLRRGGKP